MVNWHPLKPFGTLWKVQVCHSCHVCRAYFHLRSSHCRGFLHEDMERDEPNMLPPTASPLVLKLERQLVRWAVQKHKVFAGTDLSWFIYVYIVYIILDIPQKLHIAPQTSSRPPWGIKCLGNALSAWQIFWHPSRSMNFHRHLRQVGFHRHNDLKLLKIATRLRRSPWFRTLPYWSCDLCHVLFVFHCIVYFCLTSLLYILCPFLNVFSAKSTNNHCWYAISRVWIGWCHINNVRALPWPHLAS